jgi:hypothetical protein
MRLPDSIFIQTVTGDYPDDDDIRFWNPAERDIELVPDPNTVRLVPWADEPTAQVIHDCFYLTASRWSRCAALRAQAGLDLYAERGWTPVVAPEVEFYLVKTNTDSDYPLEPPVGRSGAGERPAGLQHRRGQRVRPAVRGHLRLLRGAEPRHRHADPRGRRGADGDQLPSTATRWTLADQVFLFKRTRARRRCATRHVRHLHGQAHGGRARQLHAHPPEPARRQDRREPVRRRRRPA